MGRTKGSEQQNNGSEPGFGTTTPSRMYTLDTTPRNVYGGCTGVVVVVVVVVVDIE
jgi:hypothetical protein